jgi:hypothetical protein
MRWAASTNVRASTGWTNSSSPSASVRRPGVQEAATEHLVGVLLTRSLWGVLLVRLGRTSRVRVRAAPLGAPLGSVDNAAEGRLLLVGWLQAPTLSRSLLFPLSFTPLLGSRMRCSRHRSRDGVSLGQRAAQPHTPVGAIRLVALTASWLASVLTRRHLREGPQGQIAPALAALLHAAAPSSRSRPHGGR